MADSCPNPNNSEFKEIVQKFSAVRAHFLFQSNNQQIPSFIKAHKMTNTPIDAETIKRKRQEGFDNVKKIISSVPDRFNEYKRNQLFDMLEQYGYEDDFNIVKIGTDSYELLNKNGDKATSDDVVKTLEGVKYKIASDVFKQEFAGLLIGAFNVQPTHLNVKNIVEVFKKFEFNDMDVFDLKNMFGDDLTIKSGIILSLLGSDATFYQRLMNSYVSNPDLLKGSFGQGEYDMLVNTKGYTTRQLAEYLIGRIIAETLNSPSNIGIYPMNDTVRALFLNLGKHIRNKISSVNVTAFEQVITGLESKHKDILKTLENKATVSETIANAMDTGDSIGSLSNIIKRRRAILERMLAIESVLAESAKYSKKAANVNIASHLERMAEINETLTSIYDNVEDMGEYLLTTLKVLETDILGDLTNLMNTINSTNFQTDEFAKSSAVLLKSGRIVEAYGDVIEMLQQELEYIKLRLVEKHEDDDTIKDLSKVVNAISEKIKALNIINTQERRKYLKRFFGESMPNEPIIFVDKNGKERVMSIDELIDNADKDIGLVDRLLQAVKDSNSTFLRLMNEPVSKAKAKAYNRVLEVVQNIRHIHNKLNENGISNTKFMYEFENGVPTGNYIAQYTADLETDWVKYQDKHSNFRLSLKELRKNFETEHGKIINNKFVPDSKYLSEQYKALNTAQREYYDSIMEIKEEIEMLLPPTYRDIYKAPQIRKGTVERLMQGGNMIDNIKNYLRDGWTSQKNDDYIIERATLDNSSVRVIPIRYTSKLDNLTDLTTDSTGAMIMFANMAINFDEMNNVVDSMELMLDSFKNTEISKNKKVLTKMVNQSAEDVDNMNERKIKGIESETYKRLIDFYENNIYGITSKDEGSINIGFANLDKRKVVNKLIKYTTLNTLSFNVLAGMANVVTGNHNLRMEGFAKEFFTYKDLVTAEGEYFKDLPKMIADVESRNVKSRVNILNEYFRITQGQEDKFKRSSEYRTNKLMRMFSLENSFFMMNSGEHYMANKLGLAMLSSYKMVDANGKEISLLDAIDTSTGKVIIKSGVTKKDGTPFSEHDRIKLMRKIRELSERLNGIYNDEDKNAAQRTSLGALAFLYRRYLVPTLNRRFGRINYNFALETYTEGFYTTTGKFIIGKILSGVKSAHALKFQSENLAPYQKANLRRAAYESMYVIVASSLFTLLSYLEVGDDDDDPYLERMAMYQLRRTMTEVGAFAPIRPFGVLKEAGTLLDSPMASMSYLKSVSRIVDLDSYGETIQSGEYKGWNKGVRNIVSILPFYKTIKRAATPEKSIEFLENN